MTRVTAQDSTQEALRVLVLVSLGFALGLRGGGRRSLNRNHPLLEC